VSEIRRIRLQDQVVAYELARGPRCRHVRLTVRPQGLRVSAPPRIGIPEVEAALRARAEWALRHLDRLTGSVPSLADGDRLPLLDGEVELGVRPARSDGWRFRAAEGRLALQVADETRIAPLVEEWYRELAGCHLPARTAAWAARLGVRPSAVAVRDGRSRWASCSARGRLGFSWRLVMAPARVAEYVVVHELAHLVRMDHSPEFWALVEGALPGWRTDRAWLREHGHLLERGPMALDAWPASARGGGPYLKTRAS
jgi:predicted metal-dependent hydrolase